MDEVRSELPRLLVATAIGFLAGLERERRKKEGVGRSAEGIRTFALVSLLGGVCALFGTPYLLLAGALFVGSAALIAYARQPADDPGITTEVAFFAVFALGALAQTRPATAFAMGLMVTLLLALRAPLHKLARDRLNDTEILDALSVGIAALVALPMLPNRPMGPFGAINPLRTGAVAVLVMAIGAVGHATVRIFGARLGLPLAGFASGFVSSAATVGAMGNRAKSAPGLLRPATAGAVLASLASVIQLVVLVGAISRPLLVKMALPLGLSCLTALVYGALTARHSAEAEGSQEAQPAGRAVSLSSALAFAAVVAGVLLLGAFLRAELGDAGLVIGMGAAGLADTHAPAISVASLVGDGQLPVGAAVAPILAAFTANSATKVVLAFTAGPRPYAWRVGTGVLLMLAAFWIGAFAPALIAFAK